MAEALKKLEEEKESKKREREAAAEIVKELKATKRNLKKRNWEYTKTSNNPSTSNANASDEQSEDSKRPRNFDPAERVKRKKYAILLGYCGANYYGMQRNPGMQTIEEELFKAMLAHKWITDESFDQAQNASFQRAARTDKGVSAARQVCSIKLPHDLDLKAFNADLPEEIRMFGATRVTKGFNAKDQCNARTYTYTLPTISFANYEEENDFESFRIGEEELKKVTAVLKLYEGTKNFHNFTSKKNYIDPSAKRFIMSFTHSEPFQSPQGIEFITLIVKGQSFMLHQIRKMVGVAIAIVRGNTTNATLERAFSAERLDLPMAPGLGLVLDRVHYERYNERYGKDGVHEPLTWEAQDTEIKAFIEKYINSNIYETEFKDRPMLDWLTTLSLHTYDTRRDDVPAEGRDADDE